MISYLENLLDIYLDTALWLLVGLLLAALIKGLIPESLIKRLLSGNNGSAVVRAALIGAPLPLCSCGVLPTAVGLHRSGASKPATTAFLIATPETGVDSISITYALMGPVMAVIRPLAAVFSAIVSGLLVLRFDRATPAPENNTQTHSHDHCGNENPPQCRAETRCCSDDHCAATALHAHAPPTPGLLSGLRFALGDILDDIKYWLTFGLLLAALIATLVEPGDLAAYGSGLSAMLLMLVIGLPLYICASASTPLAAALLYAGVSPGAVLVFLLVGPATNIASLGILVRELGLRAVTLYLTGISLSALSAGLLVDHFIGNAAFDLARTLGQDGSTSALHWLAGALLMVLAITPLRKRLGM